MASLDHIFKAYDVRGTVPDQWGPAEARAIGAAFARFARDRDGAARVLVARDMRPSGVELAGAFADGVTAEGVDVVDLGLASTDLLYFASGTLDAPGAIFTASHNPAQYNGIKFCLSGAKPVGQDTGLGVIQRTAEEQLVPANATTADGAKGALTEAELLDAFADHVVGFVGPAAELRPLKVVADTANGMGGLVCPAVFAHLPFELEILYGDLDGTFPNHPADPIQAENLKDLQARVLESGADVGLAFDGDADRVFLVDEQAQPISGSTTTAMVAKAMLERHPGATILHNLICSKAVPEIITENGGTPLRTRVGHSFIKETMAESGAVFGGEHSGHYYFLDNFRADSGLIAAMVVLELLSRAGQPLSEVRRPFERYVASGEINTEVADPAAVIRRIAGRFSDGAQDELDGLTVDFGDWWFNVRPSNTEPLLRLNLEARTRDECDEHVNEVLDVIRTGASDGGATGHAGG
jgi:phosphomannomutase